MKKRLLALLVVSILALSIVGLVACQEPLDAAKAEKILKGYIFEYDDMIVNNDFTLPLTIANYAVTWKSSDENAVKLEKRDEDYLAKVTKPDTDRIEVTLTVTLGEAHRDYTVRLRPIDVYDISQAYTFENLRKSIYEDFTLDTSCSYEGKTAQITWSVSDRNSSSDYIAVEGNNKVKVTPSSMNPQVILVGTFEYNDVETKIEYPFTVTIPKEPLQEVDYWYNGEGGKGVSVTLSGYVLEIGTPYDSQYGNISLYMLNDEGTAGHYIYRAKAAANEVDLIKPGAHITVTGGVTDVYNGLHQVGQNTGTIKVDKDVPAKDVAKEIYALDEDLFANAPAVLWNQSRMVSLSNWQIKAIEKKPTAGNSGILFTLEKNGVEVFVGVSKYMEGAYSCKEDNAVWKGLLATQETYNVGDYVNVTGIWGHYTYAADKKDGDQIIPLSANAITKGAADPAGTTYNGAKVAAAVNAVNEALAAAKADKMVVSAKEFTLPASSGDVTIAYKLLFQPDDIKLENGKFTISQPTRQENVPVQITYTVGTVTNQYTAHQFFTISYANLSDEQMIKQEKENLSLTNKITENTEIELSTIGKDIESVTIEWAFKEGTTPATAKIVDKEGKKYLVFTQGDAEETVTVVATVKSGETTDTVEFEVKVAALSGQGYIVEGLTTLDDEKGGTHKFGLYQANLGKTLFATGTVESGRLVTTDNLKNAVDVTYAKVEKGYTLTIGGKFLELDSAHKVVLADAATGAWAWDATLKTFTWTIGEGESAKIWYLGTYGTFDTISASETYRISGDNASTVGKTQFPAYLGNAAPASLRVAGLTTLDDEKGGTHKFGLYQANLGKTLFATGTVESGRLVTTDNLKNAVDVTYAKVEKGYTLTIGGKFLELDSAHKVVLADAATGAWAWDATLKTFTWTIGEGESAKIWYLGTYGTFDTISASETYRISGDNASTVGKTQFPAYLGSVEFAD
ncbi:MAG: hypothetical protein NC350_00325 [Corallococcus sp.]|nr:hypothetical protein [Corallococcus sp.]